MDDLAHALVRTVGDQEVDLVACHLPGENGQFMFHRNLAEEIADPEGDRPHEDRRAGLRDPD